MRLSSKTAVVLFAVLTLACDGSTAPLPTDPTTYRLESVNGVPVPAIVIAETSDTSFILSATLTLDGAGKAHRIEHWRHVWAPNHAEEGVFDANADYRIEGDRITVGFFDPCPANAVCEGNKVGKLTSTTLTLAYANDPTAPVFLYRLEPTH